MYHLRNPKAFKNVNNNTLPIITIRKFAVRLFEDFFFFFKLFVTGKRILQAKHIPFKLILDKLPGHPQHICDMYPDVRLRICL